MPILASGFALLLAAMQGDTYVHDGATIVVGDTPVRLAEIDVPDAHTPEGAAARSEMQRIVAGQVVTCRSEGDRQDGMVLATCRAGGQDIAAELVARGHALDCATVSRGRYRGLEPAGVRERIDQSPRCAP